MASQTTPSRKLPIPLVIVSALVVVALAVGAFYLTRPPAKQKDERPSPEAIAYLSHLRLSGVDMKAAENLMQQQVVEITGNIANQGNRAIDRIDVYCIFSGVNGQQVYRERVPIIGGMNGGVLEPNQTRSFRLPFDTLPDTWNRALPHLVIAQIIFKKA